MKGADTNLLVRFLVRDVDDQAAAVKTLLEEGEALYINPVVLSELYWVLVSVYHYSRNDFVRALDALLETEGFIFFDSYIVRSALSDYIHLNVGFADCLINRLNRSRNLETCTFDKRASKLDGVNLLNTF